MDEFSFNIFIFYSELLEGINNHVNCASVIFDKTNCIITSYENSI